MRTSARVISMSLTLFCVAVLHARGAEEEIAFDSQPGRIEISIGGQPFASYVYDDKLVLQPYFSNVHAPGGIRVTRKHPAQSEEEGGDHGTMHPGIWLAFGDINGADFWRNKAKVVHAGFVEQPQVKNGRGSFAVKNEYRHEEKLICTEICRYSIVPSNGGYLLTSDSTFSNDDAAFAFGDQEELGLGVRVNRKLRVKGGNGRILNAEGLKDEEQVWGQATDWCDYSGTIEGQSVGLTVMPHPDNFRRSWFHVRDYGLMLANPFGRKALTGGEKSSIPVKPGESLRLRFGVFVHGTKASEKFDPVEAYRVYQTEAQRAAARLIISTPF